MSWLFGDALVDQIVAMLHVIFGGAALDIDSLSKSVETYSSSAYGTVSLIASAVVKPVSAVIISIMAVLELARQATHIEADRELGIKIIAATMFKLVMLIVIAQNADLILGAINGAVDQIMGGMLSVAPSAPAGTTPDWAALEEQVKDAGFFDRLGLLLALTIPWVIASFAGVVVKIMVWLRFMEMYLLSAFVTLPLVFIANPDTKSVAIGYLRRYAAAALTGAVLILVIVVYAYSATSLTGGSLADFSDYSSLSAWATRNFGNLILAPTALIVLVVTSPRIARALVGDA